MPFNFPPLRIHVWGGLGSQLFGVALAHNFKRRFPHRSLLIVLHSSGVTRREPEIIQLFPEFDFVNVDDFSGRSNHDSGFQKPSLNLLFRKMARKFFLFSGFLAEENFDDRRLVRPWTLAIRGHYFHREVSPDFLNLLSLRLKSFVKSNFEELGNDITLHYRLGDLVELKNKNFIDPKRISSTMHQIKESKKVSIFSDSPDIAISLLWESNNEKSLTPLNLPTIETLYAASKGLAFVGTSSKISYWIVLLRLQKSQSSVNYLPLEDEATIEILSRAPFGVCFY